VRLQPLASGALRRGGSFPLQRLELKAEKPGGLARVPELAAPLYGVLALGPREAPTRVIIALDEPVGGPSNLLVDANANGDLTDDPAIEWTSRTSKNQQGRELTTYSGRASIELALGARRLPASFRMARTSSSDGARRASSNYLMYAADYGCEGEITLGESRYRVLLIDRLATGDFRGKPGPDSGVMLMIDTDRNGRFDFRSEMYDVGKPFNIRGTTYEVAGLTASGAELTIRASDRWVPENVPPPPDLRPGRRSPGFVARTTDGQEVRFPSTYAGKVVLLDFWATWSGPWVAELPHLIRAYDTFHDKGFEILGISLDPVNSGETVASFTRQRNIRWRQVYDGKFWKSEVAARFAIDSIPRAYLVDGDTGAILAAGDALRGERLATTIAAALVEKGLLSESEGGNGADR
jgi:hypothetical protein